MIVNTDSRGRTETGRYTWRPMIQMEADDYPPDSKYWDLATGNMQNAIIKIMPNWDELAELIWPGSSIEEYSWKQISFAIKGALKGYQSGVRDLSQLCCMAWEAIAAADPGCVSYKYDNTERGQ